MSKTTKYDFLKEHEDWLSINSKECEKVDLIDANLRTADLSGANLKCLDVKKLMFGDDNLNKKGE